ncbi:MAG TPA: glycosyltransferase family 2 protein, partial [Pseudonocardiaceae bacterium]
VLRDPAGEVRSTGVGLTALGYGQDLTDGAPPFGFCGGAALLRTAALSAAGGVPADFFCYYEDTDTAWRLRLGGHGVLAVADAVVTHAHGASSGHGSARFHRWNERNRLLMLLRCAPAPVAARELGRFAVLTARFLARPGAAPNHRGGPRLRVLAEVLARLPATLARRVVIGRRATVPRAVVWREWAPPGR